MDEWVLPEIDNAIDQIDYELPRDLPLDQDKVMPPPPPPPAPNMPRPEAQLMPPPPPPAQVQPSTSQPGNMPVEPCGNSTVVPKGISPRELRNKAEKMRRDTLNALIAKLAAMVPTIVASGRKMDKISVLRLSAHYLRVHQHVFSNASATAIDNFSPASLMMVLNLLKGFLITVTYRGLIVVVSQNIKEYLGYSQLDLLGKNLLTITHEDDQAILKEQLMPLTQKLGPLGELLMPDEPGARRKAEDALAGEKRQFNIRLKKYGCRSEPCEYVMCHVEGSLRKSDAACSSPNGCSRIFRRARARTENPYSSGNDIVFIGIVRPISETFIKERALEAYRMEYRTRHTIDGKILQTEARIAMVTGFMSHEVIGMNAMNFMHRDDVRWVIIALREMYDQNLIYGESGYRLRTKTGQFVYMRTRGYLDVDKVSGCCTTFVCTNTEVDAIEGKQLIKSMREKYSVVTNYAKIPAIAPNEEEIIDVENEDQDAEVADPRYVQNVILRLVSNLPCTPPQNVKRAAAARGMSQHVTIISPDREMVIGTIAKIYDVIKSLDRTRSSVIKYGSSYLLNNNRRTSCVALENYDTSILQDSNNIFKLDSNDPNTIFNVGEASCSSANSPITVNKNGNNIYPEDSTCLLNLDCFNGSFNYNSVQESESTFQITDPEMNFLSHIRLPAESTFIQTLPEPNVTKLQSGIKRPSELQEEDVMCKKKISEVVGQDETSSLDLPNLESIFDETIFDTHVETAINSLDTVDPSLPDLLASTDDIEQILEQLESEQQNEECIDFQ